MENTTELQEKLDAIKKQNAEKCVEKINEILKEFNCQITTSVQCVLNGEVVQPIIKPN